MSTVDTFIFVYLFAIAANAENRSIVSLLAYRAIYMTQFRVCMTNAMVAKVILGAADHKHSCIVSVKRKIVVIIRRIVCSSICYSFSRCHLSVVSLLPGCINVLDSVLATFTFVLYTLFQKSTSTL